MTGRIQSVKDKGFGFIEVDGEPKGGKNLFFHFNDRVDRTWEPRENDRVQFDMKDGMKGPQAVNLQLADTDESTSEDAETETDMEMDEEVEVDGDMSDEE